MGGAASEALTDFVHAIGDVDGGLQTRRQRLVELAAATDKAASVLAEQARGIAAERAANRTDTLSPQERMRATVIWAAGGAILVGCIIAVALGRSITRPIRRLADTMTTLAAGDLSASVPAVAARDEVGAMARACRYSRTVCAMPRGCASNSPN